MSAFLGYSLAFYYFFFNRIPWLLPKCNFISLFLSHLGGVSKPICREYSSQGYPFLSLNVYKAHSMKLFQSDALNCVNYGKSLRLWRRLWFTLLTATLASDPPVLFCEKQKTPNTGWSKFSHLRTVLFSQNQRSDCSKSPGDLHQPWLALFRVLYRQTSGDLWWVKKLHTQGRERRVPESTQLLCAAPYTQGVLNTTATFKILAQNPAVSPQGQLGHWWPFSRTEHGCLRAVREMGEAGREKMLCWRITLSNPQLSWVRVAALTPGLMDGWKGKSALHKS